MADVLLLGTETPGATNQSYGYFALHRWIALATGTVNKIKVYSLVAGNAKVAIYADSAGEPGALLGYNNTGQACSVGWNTLSISSASVTQNAYYWLASVIETAGVVSWYSGTTVMREKAATYSTFTFPDPAGTGFSSYTTYVFALGGWSIPALGRSFGYIIG